MNKHSVAIVKLMASLVAASLLAFGSYAQERATPPKFHPGLSPERARILYGHRLTERRLLAKQAQAQKVAQAVPAKNICKPDCSELRNKVKQQGSMTVIVYLN